MIIFCAFLFWSTCSFGQRVEDVGDERGFQRVHQLGDLYVWLGRDAQPVDVLAWMACSCSSALLLWTPAVRKWAGEPCGETGLIGCEIGRNGRGS